MLVDTGKNDWNAFVNGVLFVTGSKLIGEHLGGALIATLSFPRRNTKEDVWCEERLEISPVKDWIAIWKGTEERYRLKTEDQDVWDRGALSG
ncbi:hypothetical protein L2E82_36228 [Cichorium intybus]|uniref:Uncharacterized protein n=1 Tax=Cichorium intybus TaxID=13427 RepID=A0ACB9BR02_CICIN|nr:hypothetical protein L2E82_36228 [Cichorium intybus]